MSTVDGDLWPVTPPPKHCDALIRSTNSRTTRHPADSAPIDSSTHALTEGCRATRSQVPTRASPLSTKQGCDKPMTLPARARGGVARMLHRALGFFDKRNLVSYGCPECIADFSSRKYSG